MFGYRGCHDETLGVKDSMHGKRPAISTAERVIADRVGAYLEGQARILNLQFERFTFRDQSIDSRVLRIRGFKMIVAARNCEPKDDGYVWPSRPSAIPFFGAFFLRKSK